MKTESKVPRIFEDIDAWKKARAIVNQIYKLTRTEALHRDFGLAGQIRRSGVSMMSNIAEGFERNHLREKLQFYNVARGSAGEVRSLLYVIEDNFPELNDQIATLRPLLKSGGELISGLIRSTKRRTRLQCGLIALPLVLLVAHLLT